MRGHVRRQPHVIPTDVSMGNIVLVDQGWAYVNLDDGVARIVISDGQVEKLSSGLAVALAPMGSCLFGAIATSNEEQTIVRFAR